MVPKLLPAITLRLNNVALVCEVIALDYLLYSMLRRYDVLIRHLYVQNKLYHIAICVLTWLYLDKLILMNCDDIHSSFFSI